MLNEDFGSLTAQPEASSDDDKMLHQFKKALDFTADELLLNARGELSERQRKKFIRKGIIASAVTLLFSTLFVLNYLYLLFLYPRERLSESFQDLLIWGSVIFGGLYATTVITSVGLLQQHLNPRVQKATGHVEIPSGSRMLKIGGKKVILETEQAWELRRLKSSGQYTLYYFKSLLGTKLLSVERHDS